MSFKLSYEEITKYHKAGLLDSMRLSLGIPWADLVEEMFSNIDTLQDEVDAAEKELSDIECSEDSISQLQHELEVLQDEIDEYKEQNDANVKYIAELELSVEPL
tara:strand:+ start:339 stop:650 length:312 start_codon:yes stop_codon:yes gene_type:complete